MNSPDRNIVVGGWYTDSLGHVHQVCSRNESYVLSCGWIATHYMRRETRVEDFDVRPATAEEVRRHVVIDDWPEWARQDEENPLMAANDIQASLDAANAALCDAGQLAARLQQQLDESRRINAALLWDCDGSAADEPRMTLVERLEHQAAEIKRQQEELEIARKQLDATREQLRVTIRHDQEAVFRIKNNMARVHRIATAMRHLNPTVFDRIISLTT